MWWSVIKNSWRLCASDSATDYAWMFLLSVHHVLEINLRNWLGEGNIGEGLVRGGIIVIAFFLLHSLPVDSQSVCFRSECSPATTSGVYFIQQTWLAFRLQFLRDCDLCSNSKSKIGRSENKQNQSWKSSENPRFPCRMKSAVSLSLSASIKWWLNWFREVSFSVHDCNPEVRIGS